MFSPVDELLPTTSIRFPHPTNRPVRFPKEPCHKIPVIINLTNHIFPITGIRATAIRNAGDGHIIQGRSFEFQNLLRVHNARLDTYTL